MWKSSPFLGMLVALIMTVLAAAADEATTSYMSDSSFQDDLMNVTNEYRVQHNASKLEWNTTLSDYAQDLADGCKFEHSGGPYGENLGSGYGSAELTVTAWGNESTKYDFKAGEFSEETGHFTQLVWKSTTSMGCGRKECNGGTSGGEGDAPGWFVVCEYWPRGNVVGQFKENVQSTPQQDAESRAASTAIEKVLYVWVGLVTGWMVAVWF
ncbi:hypothetical protein AG0111_0g10673 [Alternaria gaisen]|uniref:Uncharacterized protein n=1 Tax=Alternaria gaisen TaxID=167740 RepID=A0ACB6F8E4_9PLEO|nr:hypothetical protein AG0111_0g10673 [Alternaria gaisen]